MTKKKEKILQTALKLFAENGYAWTSTSSIAKEAEVSEALVFRHFSSKEGLLEAVLAQGEEKTKLMFADIIMESDPKQLIRKSLEIPFNCSKLDFDFWRLQFKLKWEIGKYAMDRMKPLELALRNAFEELGYSESTMEAEFIIHFIDGIAGAILRGLQIDEGQMRKFLLRKYDLT